MDIFKLLSFREEETNSGEIDFLCSALARLAILVAATFNNLLDASVIKTLVVAGLTILQLSMGYWMQT